jgi:hypothetical protein
MQVKSPHFLTALLSELPVHPLSSLRWRSETRRRYYTFFHTRKTTDRSPPKKCDGVRPRCTTCQRARTVKECIYESEDQPPRLTHSNSFLPPFRSPENQAILLVPAHVTSSSRIGPPPVSSHLTQIPAPRLPTSQAQPRASVQADYQFVHVPLRPTLYSLPFRLADIIDPTALPISDSTTTELSMKLYVPRRPRPASV